jgi:hypothetical protein
LLFRIYRRQMRIPAGTLADMAAMIADGEYCLPALVLSGLTESMNYYTMYEADKVSIRGNGGRAKVSATLV